MLITTRLIVPCIIYKTITTIMIFKMLMRNIVKIIPKIEWRIGAFWNRDHIAFHCGKIFLLIKLLHIPFIFNSITVS